MSTQTTVRKRRVSQGDVAEKGVKFTFVLPPELARDLREAVEKGAAPSQNALVREVLRREMKRLRKEAIAADMRAAAKDPLFMQDLEECMRDFAEIDRDSLQYIDAEPQPIERKNES